MTVQVSSDAKERLQQQLVRCNLTSELVEELVDQAMVVSYPAGAIIFLQGTSADLLFWLVRGMVKIYCPQVDGTRVLARLGGPGDLMGQADFINGNGRRRQLFEVRAATKCEVALVTRDHMSRVLQKLDKPDLMRLMEALNSTWASATFWYITLLGLSFRQRLEMVLTDLAGRFGVREKRGIMVTPELSQLDLAEMIGSSRPMISRLVKEMQDSGELLRSNKQCIIAADAPWLKNDPLFGHVDSHNGNGPSVGGAGLQL